MVTARPRSRAVVERLVRDTRAGGLVDGDRDAVLEREAAVPRDVIGVRVCLEDARDRTPSVRLRVRLDLEGGVDEEGLARARSPMRYEAQPRSSSTNWRNSRVPELTGGFS